MQIKVLFINPDTYEYEHVATVECQSSDVDENLEYAFRWTQNIYDSWSKELAEDRNPNVTIVKPLYVSTTGDLYGHRSSMAGDRFVADGVTYECKILGFKKL